MVQLVECVGVGVVCGLFQFGNDLYVVYFGVVGDGVVGECGGDYCVGVDILVQVIMYVVDDVMYVGVVFYCYQFVDFDVVGCVDVFQVVVFQVDQYDVFGMFFGMVYQFLDVCGIVVVGEVWVCVGDWMGLYVIVMY